MTARPLSARLAGLLIALGLIAGSLGGATQTVVAAEETAACVDGFSTVESTRRLLPEDIHAVGAHGAILAGGAPLDRGRRAARIVRYDRSGWKTQVTKALGFDSGFAALGGTRSTGLWAVGYVQTHADVTPLVMRKRTGRGWQQMTPARSGSKNSTLADVAAYKRDAAWAVGYRFDRPGSHRPFAMHWNGKTWSAKSPALSPGERGLLAAVSSTGRGGTWVAGSAIKGGGERPYIARRTKGRWERLRPAGVGAGALAAIDVPARREGWAVGYRLASDGMRALVLRWDGESWSTVSPPDLTGETLLYDVAVADDGTVTVAGTTLLGKKLRPFLARWTGEGWSVVTSRAFGRDALMTGLDGDPLASGWAVARDIRSGAVVQGCQAAAPTEAALGDLSAEAADARDEAPGATHLAETQPAAHRNLQPATQLPVVAAGGVRIVDRAKAAGLPDTTPTYGAVIDDFDGDGLDDIFLGRHSQPATLYIDGGATYEPTATSFGVGDRHGCAASDVDGSGLPDLYCTFGGARGLGVRANQLWLDPGGPSPRIDPGAGQVTEMLGRGRAATFLDYDDDGQEDLVIGQVANRLDGLPSVNRVYRWSDTGQFAPVIRSGIAPGIGTQTFDTGDVDRDGRTDLLMVYDDPKASGRTSGLKLYRNTETGLEPIHSTSGITPISERDAELARLDRNQSLDLVQLSEDRIRVSLQRDGRFRKVYERTITEAVAVAAGDADGDGDNDLYVLRQKDRSTVNDIILFNRGNGRSFKAVEAPSRMGGTADDVFPIDHDQNGLTDFLVLNGRGSAGPVQLIAFYRR